ncbi:MAG: hypothetical protein JSW52_12265 [Candidatus Coatesbacteria bacterium]|nr:MAG: hypothetical protein JSW52_12265 [Candidatus Coatesbacteria bacterium]
MNEKKGPNTIKKALKIIAIFIPLFISGAWLCYFAHFHISSIKAIREHDVPLPGDEILMSEEFVKGKLEAHETAEFPPWHSVDITSTELGENRYEVISYFDIENAHGDTVRTHYVAVLKYEGNDRWTLESLDFN